MNSTKVIIVAAPSGSGKGSILGKVLPLFSDIAFSVSATTRAPRHNEEHNIHYHFISVEQFINAIENQEFLEWEEVYKGTYYGTLKSETYNLLNSGKHVLFEVDVKGAKSIKNYFGERALSIFIQPPSLEELKNRLITRGTETEESLKKRLDKAAYEMEQSSFFDVIVVNEALEQACETMTNVLQKFLHP